jgi:hypothetical protein
MLAVNDTTGANFPSFLIRGIKGSSGFKPAAYSAKRDN